MTDWRTDIDSSIDSFVRVTDLAGDPIERADIKIEYLEAPHNQPSRLPKGKMGVYGFWGDNTWLKIGMVGPNSNARYTSQHYNAGSAPSTFAASLANDPHMLDVAGFDLHDPGGWIKTATHRVNILVSVEKPRELLQLLEAFLHLRLKPRYEG